ncbi:MAG TPA: pyridoxamine 5'-phosphate oxidase family protein, partial [Burkholderiaceae bacterium]|nr:pyridoxamine 5'-phosphate oxidase family protein [Burkholderiaceae bacterium]
MHARLQHLAEVENGIWGELEACVEVRSREQAPHDWRIAVLATVDDDGKPDARNVVLREVEADERQLIFYTDARSPKVRQIAAAPEGTLIFWSATLGWQLRVRVRLAVEDSGLAVSSRWARLQTSAGAAEYL